MSQNKNLSAVRNNSLFLGVNESGLNLNFSPKDFIEVEDGGIIYQPGDLSDAIFLIIEGEVKLKITGSGSPTVVKKESNEFFGEKETLDNLARKSSAVANKDSILYMIRKNQIVSLIQKNSMLRSNLLGEPKEQDTEGTVQKEIVFNEPKGNLTDLPFFKKGNDAPVKDEDPEPKDIISESENEHRNNILTSDEDYSVIEERPAVDNNIFPEDNNTVYPNVSNLEEVDNHFFSDVQPSPTDVTSRVLHESEIPLLIDTIKTIFSGLSAEDIFIVIPEAICKLLNAALGRLFFIDKETGEFNTRVKKEGGYSEIKLKFADNLFTESFNEKKIININNPPLEELEKISSGTDIRSLLIFPLKNQKGDVTGILELNNSYNGIFVDDDEVVLTRLSPLINLALENVDFIQNLLQSERMISLNKIANFLIQDIRDPIVNIKQYTEHIKKQEIYKDILPVLDMIEEQADSVMNLVQTTLRYSEGILISKPVAILLSTAMDNILALLAEYVESRNVKLFKKYDGDSLVNLDRKEFYQVCFQIAKNACDAMPHGGNFYVVVTREGEFIRIEFKDTGLGIPDSIKDKIFDPFMSHGKEDHTGLGLAIAEKIVKEHNGKIWAESDLGEGSTIIIVLPASD